jgi:DNA-binding MarR family transcriptional regulator
VRPAKQSALARQRWPSLGEQACLLVNSLDTIVRRLLFSRIPDDPKIELPRRDHRALEMIGAEGPLTMTDFAAKLGVPVSTATHAASRLQKKGLVDRERSQPDRRIVRVGVTQAGHALVKTHVEFRRAMARDMLRPLSAVERDLFLDLLAKMSRLAVVSENPTAE